MGLREDAKAAQAVSDKELRGAEAALASANVPDDVASAAFDTAMTAYGQRSAGATAGAEREYAVGDTVEVGGMSFVKHSEEPFPEGPMNQGPQIESSRHGVPDSNVYDPEKGAYLAPGAPQRDLEALRGSIEKAQTKVADARPAAPTVVQGTPLHLTPQQHAVLLRGIDSNRIKSKQGQSHLEAWDVRRHLNRIFGFGGWDDQTLELTLIAQIENNEKSFPRYTVVYRAQVRLIIKNPDGTVGATFDDASAGDAINFPANKLGDAHDFAMKTALSQALKRCAVNMGDQFGLSLYNGSSVNPVVNVTLVGPTVEGGDVVEQAVRSDPVRSENETPDYLADPGQHDDANPHDGMPTPSALRDEAVDPGTSLERLRAINAMVHRRRGSHPQYGPEPVTNENGDEESLDGLIYRKIQERKQAQ